MTDFRQPLPPLRALQAFEAIVRLGTLARAAREMGVSAGALSQQIKALEDFLAVQLLERSGRGVVPTPAGRKFLPGVITGFEALHAAVKAVQQDEHGTEVRISAPASVSTRWLANRLLEWATRHPETQLRLQTSDTEPDLQSGDADFRVTYGSHVESHAHFCELFIDSVTPALSPVLLADRILHEPKELLSLPLIGVDWGPDIDAPPAGWPEWLERNGVSSPAPAAALTFSLSSAAIDAAVAGNGIVLGQLSMIKEDLRAGRLICPFPDRALALPKPYYLAWRGLAMSKPSCAELQRWLVQKCRQDSFPLQSDR